jgi:hypothetical protein
MNYNLCDTIGKTLKENKQLVKIDPMYENQYNKNLLYDFSLLDKQNIDSELLAKIKNHCFKDIWLTNRYSFILTTDNVHMSFNYVVGNVFFKAHIVYSNSKNKKVCVIMELVKIELHHKERNSVYNNFTDTEYNEQISYDYNIYDYNIA